MDYKDTLLMPDTAFEMKANLPTKEPLLVEKWQKEKTYEKMLAANAGQEPYVLHDGPPYANGNLHAGTAMNRIIKDFIIKSHAMAGYYTPFFPGWDAHGLPIENAMLKLGVDRKTLSTAEFRDRCRNFALQQIDIQKATMLRLGTLADYDNPYITLLKEFEGRQIRSFAKMALSGLIYQGLKPVYWSPAAETAVADSEIIYLERKDPAIFVTFEVVDGKGLLQDAKFVIWTTTPWTIPGNLAICLHPDLAYALVKTEKGNLVVLESLVEKLMSEFEITDYEIIKNFKGKAAEFITAKHPLYDRESLVILGEHVTAEDGTGCVHTAPGHGADDFYVGSKYGLPAFCPVDEKGCLTAEAGDYLLGVFVEDANKLITQRLEEAGNLLKLDFVTHTYPHDDRMKKPVIFRATVQWFASIEKIREELLEQIKLVKWETQWGQARMYDMIKQRGDWCISRQRKWGLPIPIIYNESGKPIIEADVFEHIAQLIEKQGSNIWFESTALDLLPPGYTNSESPNGLFTKEEDIMDVWFDSGSSFNELEARGDKYPCDIYFEGQDQYRGWFNSSLIVATATTGRAPYRSVLSHGYVNDAKGLKMSKSFGNVIDPLAIVEKNGADVLRLWAGSVDFKQDMRISDEMIKQIAENYRKVRNYFRFMLGNVNPGDFDPQRDYLAYDELAAVDRYILVKLDELNRSVQEDYKNYNYLEVSSSLLNFMIGLLSAFYLDFSKDILYIERRQSLRRRQVQNVLYRCITVLARLWAPILSFTMEEIWQNFSSEKDSSIFQQHFPSFEDYPDAVELNQNFECFLKIKDDVFKALEEAREAKLIGKSLEAQVYLNVSAEDRNLLTSLFDNIAQIFIVSQFDFTTEQLKQYEYCQVKVEKATGQLCPRCWNIGHSEHPDALCPRCQKIVE